MPSRLPDRAGTRIGDMVMDMGGPARIYILTRCTKCRAPVRALFACKPETVQTCPRCGARKEGNQP